MPKLAPRLCSHPGCGAVSTARFCTKHAEQHRAQSPGWQSTKGSSTSRGYGANWRRLRRMILSRDPICVLCRRAPSVTVDHIKSKAERGKDEDENLRGLCDACHKRKTGQDGARGRARDASSRFASPI